MEALCDFFRFKTGITICKHEVILCGELIVSGILRLVQQYQFFVGDDAFASTEKLKQVREEENFWL